MLSNPTDVSHDRHDTKGHPLADDLRPTLGLRRKKQKMRTRVRGVNTRGRQPTCERHGVSNTRPCCDLLAAGTLGAITDHLQRGIDTFGANCGEHFDRAIRALEVMQCADEREPEWGRGPFALRRFASANELLGFERWIVERTHVLGIAGPLAVDRDDHASALPTQKPTLHRIARVIAANGAPITRVLQPTREIPVSLELKQCDERDARRRTYMNDVGHRELAADRECVASQSSHRIQLAQESGATRWCDGNKLDVSSSVRDRVRRRWFVVETCDVPHGGEA